MGKLYMRKENRDAAYKKIPKNQRGGWGRGTVKGQLIHPMYIEDYSKVTGSKLSDSDKGFGNTMYKTRFGTLYELIEKRERGY